MFLKLWDELVKLQSSIDVLKYIFFFLPSYQVSYNGLLAIIWWFVITKLWPCKKSCHLKISHIYQDLITKFDMTLIGETYRDNISGFEARKCVNPEQWACVSNRFWFVMFNILQATGILETRTSNIMQFLIRGNTLNSATETILFPSDTLCSFYFQKQMKRRRRRRRKSREVNRFQCLWLNQWEHQILLLAQKST